MRNRMIIAVVVVGLLVTGSVFVIGQKAMHKGFGPFGMGGPRGHMMGMALRGLDLTADQKAKVGEIMAASRGSIKPLMEQLRDGHKQLAALGSDGTFDQAKTESLAAEQAGIMSKLIVERAQVKAQIFAILTPDQKAKAAEMKQKFEQRMKDRGSKDTSPGGDKF